MTDGRLAGKTALVTGASRGIGRAIALAYGRQGADVFLTATNLDNLVGTRDQLADMGVEVACHAADVGNPDEVEALFSIAAA
ncbi:MAG: SDR family NAD(P)-dependent oxidoreductase, partial [Xanthomonadales bacterium]|nr:SDR family NAD(P)-dependent oxidoreductase [Xanthomonadales bacterium]NIN75842.1 SDR family NAD(P)-dependent oxidoreductase [Xanthomonadales bacterium]NIP12880.1 SDR family NAD(P)-dependent oxidoreductase [Xanthomonadales bacterium]